MRRFWSGLLLGAAALPALAQAQEDRGPIESKEDAIAAVRARVAERTAARADREARQDEDAPRAPRGRFEGDAPVGTDAPRPDRQDRPDRPRFDRGDRARFDGQDRPRFDGQGGRDRPRFDREDRPDRPRFDRADRDRPEVDAPPPVVNGDGRREGYRPDRGRVAQDVGDRLDRRLEDRGDRRWNWRRDRDDDRWWNRSSFGERDRAGVFRPWSRDWRGDERYDWNRYRQSYGERYRLPRYYAPSGWAYGYRRFGIGASLSAFLYDDGYWIDDPWYYRLPPAYGPYRWVRYYGDALLVDLRTGRVMDVVYDIFR